MKKYGWILGCAVLLVSGVALAQADPSPPPTDTQIEQISTTITKVVFSGTETQRQKAISQIKAQIKTLEDKLTQLNQPYEIISTPTSSPASL